MSCCCLHWPFHYSHGRVNNRHLISLEGHGRDAFEPTIDLSQTIGWFTSIYPVNLIANSSDTLTDVILRIRDEVRTIPQGGFGYPLLRYLHYNNLVRDSLRYENLIEFNYLGQTDNITMVDSSLGIELIEESMGQVIGPENHRTNELEIDVIIVNQQLSVKVSYAACHYDESTVQNIANDFIHTLEQMVIEKQNFAYRAYAQTQNPI